MVTVGRQQSLSKKFEVAATCAEFKMIMRLFLYLNADKVLYGSQFPNEDYS